ncbi:MAG: sigma 54-interacting transcriptional regulator [Bacteroidota bacterium]
MPDAIIGGSPAIKKLRGLIPQLSAVRTPVIIVGETGVGKSLTAAHIHSNSSFNSSELLTINFSILSERDQRVALLGGGPPELTTTRRSALEVSTTVVLKHLDFATPFLQNALAEILRSSKLSRLGSTETSPLMAHVILTFRQPLTILHRRNLITSTLYAALKAYKSIHIPPLRKRKPDIPLLAHHFLDLFHNESDPNPSPKAQSTQELLTANGLDPAFADFLEDQKWEENVTQLKAYLRSLIVPDYRVALQEKEKIEVMKMLLFIEEGREFSLRQSISTIENAIVERALQKHAGRQSKAAQMLGVTDRSLRRRS